MTTTTATTENKSYYELANDMDIEIIHTKYIHAEKYWIVMCKRYENHYVNWVHANGMFLHGHYFGSQFDNGFVDGFVVDGFVYISINSNNTSP